MADYENFLYVFDKKYLAEDSLRRRTEMIKDERIKTSALLLIDNIKKTFGRDPVFDYDDLEANLRNVMYNAGLNGNAEGYPGIDVLIDGVRFTGYDDARINDYMIIEFTVETEDGETLFYTHDLFIAFGVYPKITSRTERGVEAELIRLNSEV